VVNILIFTGRTPEQLALAIEDSRKHNYSLGVKLVRGAYHPHELEAHRLAIEFDNSPHAVGAPRPSSSISPDAEPPVWREKRDTDYNYNECVKMLARVVKEDVDQCSRSASGSASVASVKGWYDWVKGTNTPTKIIQDTPPVASSPGIGVLFGTHNWESCALILKELVRNGLAVEDSKIEGGIKVGNETVERVAIGQLYGEHYSPGPFHPTYVWK
jgi:proline dehydrogenase